MRHPHRFSRPRSADAGSYIGHERASLHALLYELTHHHARRRERVSGDFESRHGWRSDWHAFPGNGEGRHGRHALPGDVPRRRAPRELHGDAADPRGRSDLRADARNQGHHGHSGFSLHALWHAIGHHHEQRGGGRGGRFGGGPGGFGGDGDGFPRARKFSSDDLQLLLLSLIDAQPSHGYELIKALEARSNGFYSPSPGMVYPALTYLEELGYVTVQLEGNRKRYELAEPGRDYLAANRERVELMLAKLTHIARKMDSVRRALAGEEPADISEGGWLPELTEARRALKHALLRRDNAPAAEQRRIAAILMRAAKEIEGEGKPGNAGNTGNPGCDNDTAGSEPTA